ncbi:MAG: tripartite tricarboxylate transporter substrate-binding protein [Alphaproteobacteria bacterium]|nr:tripartite tricarboxylate transporter substrate-binding protein [Alphaproteobacteria bacterium]
MRKHSLIVLALALAAAGIAAPQAAKADAVADFYKGKQVKMVIRSTTGGGYDLYARMLMRHMTRYIPGKPRAVNINMPGGGGIKAANYVAQVAPRDGTVLTIVSQGLPMYQGLKLGSKLKADMKAFNWIGNLSISNQILVVWHTSTIKTLEDAKKRKINVGTTGAGSISTQLPAVYNNILGTKFNIIFGYFSGGEINFAMERGEVEGRGTNTWASWKSATPRLVKEKLIRPLIQTGLKKEADLPDVPLLKDLATNPEDKAVLEYVSKAIAVGRPIAVAQGVPMDRVTALRAAFDATLVDPKFKDEAEKQRAEIAPMSGVEMQKLVTDLVDAPEDLRAKVLAAIDPKRAKATKRQVTLIKVTATLDGIGKKGRTIMFKNAGKSANARVTSRSKIKIAGKKAKRGALKTGMNCTIAYEGDGALAHQVTCK